MNLRPAQWETALFRHGLPRHLRIAASHHFRGFDDDSSPGRNALFESATLVRDLKFAQKHFSIAHPSLQNSNTDPAAAGPGEISEIEEDNPATPIEDLDHVSIAAEDAAGPGEISEREEDDSATQIEEQVVVREIGTAKRRRGNPPEGNATSVSVTNAATRRTRARRPNDTERVTRTNLRRLAEPDDPASVTVKVETSDAKGSNLYFLGPLMTAYSVFPYQFYFATNLPKPGPFAMNVATLPKQKLMTRILNDTMRNYARSRTSQNFTDAALLSLSDQDTVQPVDLDEDVLKESTHITKAKTFKKSLAMVSDMWKQKQTIGVHQKLLESWAIAIVYNAVGLAVGQEPPTRAVRSQIKQAAYELMPVLKPTHMQGISDQTIIRTQYYWKLLAEFRTVGLPFIVAYRTSTVDTALLADGASRLRGNDIPAWVPTIKAVESHITDWFDALEGEKGRSDLGQMRKSIVAPSTWASPWDQSLWNSFRQAPTNPKLLYLESALGLHKYGYNGWMSKRKSWSVMEVPETRQSIAIADIPEASFLGVVPGILRCSAGFEKGCIPGPDGIWPDTRDSKGSLAKITLGAKQETNTVLAWHIAGDCGAPAFQTAFVLAFSCRPV